MAQCPRCKDDMPLLSKICPTCGHVEQGKEGDGNVMSPDEVATLLERILHAIKGIPKPSFMKSMGALSFVVLPILTIFLLIVAIVSEAGLFWILFLLFAVFSIVAIVRKSKGTLGNQPFNNQFESYKNDYNYFERKASRDYGKSGEIRSLLSEIAGEIDAIEKERKQAAKKNLMIWAVISVLIIALGVWGVASANKAVNGAENMQGNGQAESYAAQGEWQKAVDAYKAMDPESGQAPSVRQEVVAAILAAGDGPAAEDFFFAHCMGQIKDYECAKQIVDYYKAKEEPDAAGSFVNRCTSMRYGSDVTKLKKQL